MSSADSSSLVEISRLSRWEKLHCDSIENYMLDQCNSIEIQ